MGNFRGVSRGVWIGSWGWMLACGAEPDPGASRSQGVMAAVQARGDAEQTGSVLPVPGVDAVGAALGRMCTGAEQCGSGHCVDGVCCTSACEGPCLSCVVDGLQGQCTVTEALTPECSAERLTELAGSEGPQLGTGIDGLRPADQTMGSPLVGEAGSPTGDALSAPDACSSEPVEGCESCGPRDVCLGPGQCVPPVRSRISAGGSHTCAIRTDGRLRCWGDNFYGELGLGLPDDVGNASLPSDVPLVDLGEPAVELVASAINHTCALLTGGTVRCWGDGFYGALGLGNTNVIGDDELPLAVGSVDLGGVAAVDLAAANERTCVILENGELRCWGLNDRGQLGLGFTDVIGDDEPPMSVPPVDLGGGQPIQVAVGSWHSCSLSRGGRVRCWGANEVGTLGSGVPGDLGDDELPSTASELSLGCEPAVQIAAGHSHSCALMQSGSVRCWGQGVFGALGLGSTENVGDDELPGEVSVVELGAKAIKVVAGGAHSCALLASGQVRCWGANDEGATGLGRLERVGDDELPTSVSPVAVGSGPIVDISSSSSGHTCVMLANDEVRCWGVNNAGQLGLGHTETIGDNELPSSVPPVQL